MLKLSTSKARARRAPDRRRLIRKPDRATLEARLIAAMDEAVRESQHEASADGRNPDDTDLDDWIQGSLIQEFYFDHPDAVRDLARVLAKHASDDASLIEMTRNAKQRARCSRECTRETMEGATQAAAARRSVKTIAAKRVRRPRVRARRSMKAPR